VIRIDQQINDKQHFFSRFVRGFRTETNGNYGWQQVAAPGNSYSDGRLNQGGNADLTSVLSPSTVLTSRVGYFRHDLWITLYASGFDPTTLGFPSSLMNTLPPYFPNIAPSGYQTFGASRSYGNQFTESASWSWAEIVNRTVRRHQVKFGGEFRVMLDNINSPTTNFGNYTFSAGWTQQNALTANAAGGNSIASLLLGMPSGGSAPINAALAYGYHYYGVFFAGRLARHQQADPELGLRWDYESPVTERNNQINAGFDFNANSPVQVANPLQPGVTLKGGLLFAGSGNRMPYQRDLNNFQPRVGVAWHPANKTVVRAGYGLSYVATFTRRAPRDSANPLPTTPAPTAALTSPATISTIPIRTGILTPTGSKGGCPRSWGSLSPSRTRTA
jgi:hypothetical protein